MPRRLEATKSAMAAAIHSRYGWGWANGAVPLGGSSKGSSSGDPARDVKKRERQESLDRQRVKLRAKGDDKVPVEKRFFLETTVKVGKAPLEPIPLFVSREWTIGRVVDFIATRAKVPNNNNKPGRPKLVLLHCRSGAILPFDIPLALLEPEVVDGDKVVLQLQAAA
jgi:hypothetical protein